MGPGAASGSHELHSRFVGKGPECSLQTCEPPLDIRELLEQRQRLLPSERGLARREHCDAASQDLDFVLPLHRGCYRRRTYVSHTLPGSRPLRRTGSCHTSSIRSVACHRVGDRLASRMTSSRSGRLESHRGLTLLRGPILRAGRSMCRAR